MVRQTLPSPPAGGEWHGGARVRAGTGLFLIHEPVLVDLAPDGGYISRRAKARQLEPTGRDVWLTQISVRQDTAAGRGRLRALRREANLVAELSTVVGAPRLVDFQAGDRSATLVTEQPNSRPLTDVFGPPGTPYPCFVLDARLRDLPTLVQALAAREAAFPPRARTAVHVLIAPLPHSRLGPILPKERIPECQDESSKNTTPAVRQRRPRFDQASCWVNSGLAWSTWTALPSGVA